MSKKLNMKFVVDTKKPVKSITELQDRISTLRDTIEGAPLGTPEFKALQAQLQNASSEMKVLEKNMEGLEPQQKAEAFLKMGEGIAGGFAVAQGAMGLMGVDSENLEKIQVKVQSAIAIAQGVRMMSEAALMAATVKRIIVEKSSQVFDKAGVVLTYGRAGATAVWAGVQGVLTGAIGLSTVAMHLLKLAIIATGIGALIVGIGSLIGLVMSWSSSTDVNVESQKKLNEETQKLNSNFQKQLDFKNDLEDADTEAEKQLVRLIEKQRDYNKDLDHNNDRLKINAEELENINDYTEENSKIIKDNTKILAGNGEQARKNLTTVNDQIRAQRDLINLEAKAAQDAADNLKELDDKRKRSHDRYKQRQKDKETQAEDVKSLQNELLLLQEQDDALRQQMANEQARQKALLKAGDIRDETLRLQTIKSLNDKYDQIELNRLQAIQDEKDKITDEEEKKEEDHQRSLTELKGTALKEYSDSLKTDRQRELDELQEHHNKILEAESLTADERVLLTDSLREQQKEINSNYDEIEKLEQEAATAAKFEIAQSVLDSFAANMDARQTELDNQLARELAVEGLSDDQKIEIQKKFNNKKKALDKKQKAIAASSAVIQTYLGATAAFTSMASIPYVGPVLGGIAAGAAVLSGLANVRAIYAQDVGDGGGGGGGGGGVNTPTVSSTAPATTGAFTLGGGDSQPEPIKAYVVTDEMTDSQSQLDGIRTQSTI